MTTRSFRRAMEPFATFIPIVECVPRISGHVVLSRTFVLVRLIRGFAATDPSIVNRLLIRFISPKCGSSCPRLCTSLLSPPIVRCSTNFVYLFLATYGCLWSQLLANKKQSIGIKTKRNQFPSTWIFSILLKYPANIQFWKNSFRNVVIDNKVQGKLKKNKFSFSRYPSIFRMFQQYRRKSHIQTTISSKVNSHDSPSLHAKPPQFLRNLGRPPYPWGDEHNVYKRIRTGP